MLWFTVSWFTVSWFTVSWFAVSWLPCRGSLCRGYPVVGVRPKPSSNFYQRRLGRLGRVRNKNIKMADERDPAERVRKLVQFAGQVAVDNSIAPKKYFRSGVEMERMVSVHLYVHAEVS